MEEDNEDGVLPPQLLFQCDDFFFLCPQPLADDAVDLFRGLLAVPDDDRCWELIWMLLASSLPSMEVGDSRIQRWAKAVDHT